MTRYFALLDGRRGAYGVAFPDLPGCTAMGRTIEETLRNAMEAASEWSEAVAKVPHPRSPEVLAADPEVRRALAAGASLVVVPVIRESGRPTRANISMDAGTLAAIDEEAAARGPTRSAFIAGAALEKRTAHQARSVRRPLLS